MPIITTEELFKDEHPKNIITTEDLFAPEPKPTNRLASFLAPAVNKVAEFTFPIQPMSKIGEEGLPKLPTNNPVLKSLQLENKSQDLLKAQPNRPYGMNVATEALKGSQLLKPSSYLAGMVAGEGAGKALFPIASRIATTPMGRNLIQKQLPTMAKGLLDRTSGMPVRAFGTPDVNKVIDTTISRAIKPSVIGKETSSQVQNYFNNARQAVKYIYDNRSNLQFLDEAGQPIKKLPENLKEFSSAIEQTKAQVFKKYDTLKEQAEGAGAVIPLNNIVKELRTVANNKVLKDIRPEVATYAKEAASRFSRSRFYTPSNAQAAIKIYNESLESFYKNPTYENASKAVIDAGVVNNLRKELDSAIESSTGQQYQYWRNVYKALKTIEKDTNKQAIISARKANKGFFDLTDIFSGGDIAKGIMSFDPAMMAKGFVQKGISAYYKATNEPNFMIKSMFDILRKQGI